MALETTRTCDVCREAIEPIETGKGYRYQETVWLAADNGHADSWTINLDACSLEHAAQLGGARHKAFLDRFATANPATT